MSIKMNIKMNISVKSSLIKSIDGKIKYKTFESDGREHYHLGLWIDGREEELNEIYKVEYELHPTFKKPIRSSNNRKNKFSITFWTWGTFDILVKIYKWSGEIEKLDYYMDYKLPKDDGETYIDVSRRDYRNSMKI